MGLVSPKSNLDLEKIVETIMSETNNKFEVFGTDITKDEVEANRSFFIYDPFGDLSPAEGPKQWKQEFLLSFVTREDQRLSTDMIFKLKDGLRRCRLYFDSTESDYGRMADSDQQARMLTLYFHSIVKEC